MLIGPKVLLRPVEESDLETLARWRNHPDIRRDFFNPFLFSQAGQRRWYEALLSSDTKLMFMVDALDGGKTVGAIGLDHIDYRNQVAEMEQALIDPDEREQGYALDAVKAITRYAFEDLNLHRIYVLCLAFNRQMIDLIKEAGFQEEAVLRQSVCANGKYQDVIQLALLREEWEG